MCTCGLWGFLFFFPLSRTAAYAVGTVTATAACVYVCVKYLSVSHPAPERAERFIRAPEGRMHALCAMALWELFIFAAAALITALLRLIPPLRKWL